MSKRKRFATPVKMIETTTIAIQEIIQPIQICRRFIRNWQTIELLILRVSRLLFYPAYFSREYVKGASKGNTWLRISN